MKGVFKSARKKKHTEEALKAGAESLFIYFSLSGILPDEAVTMMTQRPHCLPAEGEETQERAAEDGRLCRLFAPLMDFHSYRSEAEKEATVKKQVLFQRISFSLSFIIITIWPGFSPPPERRIRSGGLAGRPCRECGRSSRCSDPTSGRVGSCCT